MPTPANIKKFQYHQAIPRRYWDLRSNCELFDSNPVSAKIGGGAAGGAAGDENVLVTPRSSHEYHILGTQTITAPKIIAGGLDLGSMDQTADDGLELNTGLLSSNPFSYKVGTDAGFYVRVRTSIENVSGTDDFAMGFRKVEANNALDSYSDFAVINAISGDIYTETNKGGAGTVSTDTTDNWADTEEKWVEIQVSAAGVVSYLVNNQAPTTLVDYTFTDALTLIPFIYFLQDTDIAGEVPVQWEYGFIS